jgi:hypothetical protein
MNKKCYIAGKIGDLPEEIYKANFEKAKNHVVQLGLIPISPIDLPHDHDKSWRSYMIEDLTTMMQCSFVYVMDGWLESKGARIEIELARKLQIKILYQS